MTATVDTATTGGRAPFGTRLRDWWGSLDRWQQWAVIIPAVVLIYLLPVLNPPLLTTEPGTDFQITLFNAARIALIAIGLNIVVGQAGLLDLGYVGFFAVGAYTTAVLSSPDSFLNTRYPWLICIPVAMFITAISGLILGAPTLRLRGDYLAIVTLGFGEIVRLLADNLDPLRGQRGFSAIPGPEVTREDGSLIFTSSDGTPWYWLTVTVIILVLMFVGNLERSRVGRAWVAIREDEDAAEAMGVPTFRYKLWAFAMGATVGGLSGSIYAGQVGFINSQGFDVITSILFLAAVVLGGSGNKVGVILGAFIIVYIPDRFQVIAEYRFLIFGLAIIVLMIFRPQGLLGARQRLLTYGRRAYQRLIGRPEQISSESALGRHADEVLR
jgi:branched-chain amino acid transport system permease protein